MDQLNLSFSDEPTIIIWRATPRGAIEALEQWLQEQMPPCWKITCFKLHGEHHQLTGYELQVGFDVFTIGAEGHGALPIGGWFVTSSLPCLRTSRPARDGSAWLRWCG